MATFQFFSQVFYDSAGTRSIEANYPTGSVYNSTDIDDGNWNVGDERTVGSAFDYAGYFDSGGIRILVFTSSLGTYMISTSQSAGATFTEYPATYQPGDVTLVTNALPVCYGAGTQITTVSGFCKVEDLRIGDIVLTSTGSKTPVKWVGRQTLHKLTHGPHMQPVRIRAGALGDGLPHSDLTVTADHGMIIDGLVINASALVNGDSIDWVPMSELDDRFTVYHIETEAHDVILANGAASETFVDAAGRAAFDNYQEYLDLYGTERIIPEMRNYRITTPRLLPDAIKARIGMRKETGSNFLCDVG